MKFLSKKALLVTMMLSFLVGSSSVIYGAEVSKAGEVSTNVEKVSEIGKVSSVVVASNVSSSKKQGTLSNPVKLKTEFTYADIYNLKDEKYNSYKVQYSVKINKVTPISYAGVEKLGFKRPDGKDGINYVLLDLSIKVKNATMTKGKKSEFGYEFLNLMKPSVFGVKDVKGEDSIIGGTDYGFDGSLDRNLDKILGDNVKLYPGQSRSYQYSGKLLLPVLKGKESLFAIRYRDYSIPYEESFIYFKLK
ncbi:hypothetical protein J2T13_003124 [Paenibacillus sp. DS2015]|uniref:hypothetical protein n=1 Tax=Paenibacillus sp. DS2015 TaxID=3373917 RepID=UPI003D1C5803